MTRAFVVLAALLVVAAPASAEGPPSTSITSPVLASQPWNRGPATPTARVVRDVWIAPETYVVAMRVPLAEPKAGAPRYAVVEQTVVVPGYWVVEMTDEIYIPQHLGLERVAPGVYQWRVLPAEVRAR